MKSIGPVLAIIFLSGFLSIPTTVSADQHPAADQGSWQVVTNKKQKKVSVVQFYNNKKELIYEERVEGVKLNLRDWGTIRLLNELLLKTLTFSNGNKVNGDSNLVSWALKSRRKKVTS